MKLSTLKFYSIILLFFIVNISNAQKISLAELHTMSANKSWETSNKFLLSKGWEYNNSEKGDDEHYNKIIWAYHKTGYEKEKATAWFYVYTYDGLPNKVMYRFREKNFYFAIKQQLVINKYKLQEEEVLDEKVIATYSNPSFVLQLEYARETNEDEEYNGSFTVYNITVYKKGGVYDPDNGVKKEYDSIGNLTAEYSLKSGKLNGLIKFFNKDGSVNKTSFMTNGIENGISTEYIYQDSTGILLGKYKGNMINNNKSGKWLLNVIKDEQEINLSYTNYVNGIEEGEFRSIKGDSIIYSTYKNGLINGKYNVYRDLNKILFGGIAQTDTTKIIKTSIGQFTANKKTGYWKNYHMTGTIESDGNYIDSLKMGKWNTYYEKYVDENSIETLYSRKLYMVENYSNGKKNGETNIYSNLEKVEIPCKDSTNLEKCYKLEYRKIKEKTNYIDDVLDGPYQLLDENDKILYKGQYANGKEFGKWIIRNSSEVDFWLGENIEIGNYSNGAKEGKWERFDDNENLIESYHYKNGVLDGEHILYSNNNPFVYKEFKDGILQNLKINDSLGKLKTSIAIYAREGKIFKCTLKQYSGSKITTDSYKIIPETDDKFHPAFFKKDFNELSNNEKIAEGLHSIVMDEKTIEEGKYLDNKKSGIWNYYFVDQNIKLEIEYNALSEIVTEKYYDINTQDIYSGEFIYKEEESNITEERKIKEGLRNGTTRYKDASDKTIKKESYKDGVLKA
jgi:antitoxin component YwqK of YwqJK toxin-antitoxin module